jgi:cytochrome c oxidase subunit 4
MTERDSNSPFTPAAFETLKKENDRYFTFFNVTIALVVMTFIEILIVVLPFHPVVLLVGLILLSLVKFALVIWYFMHLKWEHLLLPALFVLGLVLATGTAFVLFYLFPKGESVMQDNPAAVRKVAY